MQKTEEAMDKENVYLKPVTLRNILKFAVPTIAMTVFVSFYTMVDGFFVSNLIGTDALSAINLTAPVIQFVTAISTMLATGGSAVIMKKMGELKSEEAKEDFTFLIVVNVFVGIFMCILGYSVMDHVFAGMNLSADVEGYCVEYLSRYLIFTVPILLMNNFTLYMIASGKATLSLIGYGYQWGGDCYRIGVLRYHGRWLVCICGKEESSSFQEAGSPV